MATQMINGDMKVWDVIQKYPETFAHNVDSQLMYAGPWRLEDSLADSSLTIG